MMLGKAFDKGTVADSGFNFRDYFITMVLAVKLYFLLRHAYI